MKRKNELFPNIFKFKTKKMDLSIFRFKISISLSPVSKFELIASSGTELRGFRKMVDLMGKRLQTERCLRASNSVSCKGWSNVSVIALSTMHLK